ncbi:class I SAM-dependent methyltransferase family protein [Microlunatus speluncae]|uniref:class I SAM-dependent methyltransferase family protein n=1 Tax=Microlunatus speluncae TaxID=2594267 RepID=UPI001266890C|nr:class I SAM-dependent methyltransferase family protein [Microlunatus speluncae]
MDWHQWHQGYQGGGLAGRLPLVQDQLRQALTETRPGPIMIISVCAGQGHDVIGVFQDGPRQADVRARLVEWDHRNVAEAQRRVDAAGLGNIEVRQGDAGLTDAYVDAAPAQIVLLCGVFGSLTEPDINRTVGMLPQLCDENAQVIWTAHRSSPDLYRQASAAFDRHGLTRRHTDPDDRFGVTRHQLVTQPTPLQPGRRMFEFADEQTLIDIGRITLS